MPWSHVTHRSSPVFCVPGVSVSEDEVFIPCLPVFPYLGLLPPQWPTGLQTALIKLPIPHFTTHPALTLGVHDGEISFHAPVCNKKPMHVIQASVAQLNRQISHPHVQRFVL
jgi:hypothetical protein